MPLLIGVNFVQNRSITIGELIVFSSYVALIFSPISSLIKLLPLHATLQVYDSRVSQIVNLDNFKNLNEYGSEKNIGLKFYDVNPIL